MTKPVLIVGAGPVGLTMACELARYGVPLRTIDTAAQRTDKSKALVLWSRTLELLDRGASSAPFIDAGFKADAVNFYAGGKTIGHISMREVQSPYPYALMLPQSETERLLDERLQRCGVKIERSVELTSFATAGDGVDAVLRHADGREEQVPTEWLLGCDGAHSAVRHGLQAPFAGETMDSDWVLADVHMRGYPSADNEVAIHWHHDGVFVIFPISPGRYRIIADRQASGAAHPPTPTLQQIQELVDRRGPPGMTVFDPIWLAGFRINGRKVADYRHGRAFLLGDAAHVHSPAGGQGMNTGMQDAFNLAWKLALVIHGHGDERLLDSYSAERSRVGDQVLEAADRMTKIGTTKNPAAQLLRNGVGHLMLGLTPVQHRIAETMTEVTIGYPDSPLNGATLRHGPKAGARVAPRTDETPAGAGAQPRFALHAQPSDASVALTTRYAALLDDAIRPPLHDEGFWLVRPDGYLACASHDTAGIAAYLESLARH